MHPTDLREHPLQILSADQCVVVVRECAPGMKSGARARERPAQCVCKRRQPFRIPAGNHSVFEVGGRKVIAVPAWLLGVTSAVTLIVRLPSLRVIEV